MKNTLLKVIALALLVVGFAGQVTAQQIVVIRGSGAFTTDFVKMIEEEMSGAVVIGPRTYWPLDDAAADILQQLKEKGVDISNGFKVVGYSWGGLIARQLDADNPGLAKKVVTVASPVNSYRLSPSFMPGDGKSLTPLIVIGGYKPGLAKSLFMRGEMKETDDVVPIESIIDPEYVGREAAATVTFIGPEFDHRGLMRSREVAREVARQIYRELTRTESPKEATVVAEFNE
jgi:pimeloyl-ACP methyl ester carboxylesterase